MDNLDSEQINKIINSNNIVIPAGLLMYYIKFMESVTVRAGVVRPGEMVTAGKNYEYSIHIINSLIADKSKETLPSIPEEKIKKKKKKKIQQI